MKLYKRKGKLGKKNKSSKQSRNVTKCLATFIEYSRINELKARSVQQQVNRVNNFKKILDNKKGKKGNFKGTYKTLLSALGGNESSPECDGNPIGANRTSRQAKYKGINVKVHFNSSNKSLRYIDDIKRM